VSAPLSFTTEQVQGLYREYPYPYSAAHELPTWLPLWFQRKLVKPRGKRYLRHLRSELGPRMRESRLLDAGCGTGEIVTNMAYSGDWKSVTGIDVTPRSLELAGRYAKRHGVEIDLKQVDLTSADEMRALGEFDVILSLGVLHHVHDPPAALRLLVERLAEGGLIVIYVYATQVRGAFRRGLELVQLLSDGVAQDPAHVAAVLTEVGLVRPRAGGWRRWVLKALGVSLEAAELARAVDDFAMPFQVTYSFSEFSKLLADAGLEVVNRWDGFPLEGWDGLLSKGMAERAERLEPLEQDRLKDLLVGPGRFAVAARKAK
jgi:2-polyprenyl-3-methyl-5-hydroxy-6-metoxy-1,4-benzoquinol methylase